MQSQVKEWCDAVNAEAKHQQDLIQSDLGVARTLAPGTHAAGPHLTKTLITSKVYGISSFDSNAMKSDNPKSGIYEAATSRTLDLNGGSPACNQGGMAVVQSAGVDTYNQTMEEELAQPLCAADGGNSTPKVVCIEGNGQRESHKGDGYKESDTMHILNSTEHHAVAVENHPADSRVKVSNVPMVMEEPYNATTGSFMRAGNSGIAETLAARDYKDPQIVCNSVVRRLTPLECERLQDFPSGWTNIGEWVDSKGKKHKDADSPRYKALGNSIALPFWQYLADKMCAYLENPTMASLFDGISGFCLVFARAGAKPVFSSEIEEFPIAVAKKHFGDDEKGVKGDYEKYL